MLISYVSSLKCSLLFNYCWHFGNCLLWNNCLPDFAAVDYK